MTVYQYLLQYYLDSNLHFKSFATYFFEAYSHMGECGDKLYADTYSRGCDRQGKHYSFETALYRQCVGRVRREGGYALSLSDTLIQKYFTAKISEEQRFALIFSHWYGLQDAQVENLIRLRKNAWELLQYYLCNRSKTDTLIPVKNHYSGSYYVYAESSCVKAHYSDGGLILKGTGERLEIV